MTSDEAILLAFAMTHSVMHDDIKEAVDSYNEHILLHPNDTDDIAFVLTTVLASVVIAAATEDDIDPCEALGMLHRQFLDAVKGGRASLN